MNRFAQIPEIPDGLPAGLSPILQAIKQNLEALAGQSGLDKMAQAVKYGEVLVADIKLQAAAAAANPPTKTEFDKAVADLEELARLHNYLAAQLRGEEVGS